MGTLSIILKSSGRRALKNGKFILSPAEGEQRIVAADKAGNSVTASVTVEEKENEESPDMGDQGHIALWSTLLFASGSVLTALIIKRKKQER